MSQWVHYVLCCSYVLYLIIDMIMVMGRVPGSIIEKGKLDIPWRVPGTQLTLFFFTRNP